MEHNGTIWVKTGPNWTIQDQMEPSGTKMVHNESKWFIMSQNGACLDNLGPTASGIKYDFFPLAAYD